MFRAGFLALLTCMVMLSGGSVGQDKKDEPKKQSDEKKVDKKDDVPTKAKGKLPSNWTKLGLSDTQVQSIYKIQNKYNDEIDKLRAKMDELRALRDREEKAVLTPEQKKRLEDIQTGRDKDK